MDHEYQGAFLSEEAKKKIAPAEEGDEVFDKELRQLLGNRYQDATAVPTEYDQVADEEVPEEKSGISWGKARALGGLIAGVGLLLYMVANGKIDTDYGLVFTAVVSATCGYHLK